MPDQVVLDTYEAVNREIKRTEYPEDFPAMPEIPVGRYTDQSFYDLE